MLDDNPFIRFKHHINDHIALGFQSLLGLPSVVSRGWTHPSPNPSSSPHPLTPYPNDDPYPNDPDGDDDPDKLEALISHLGAQADPFSVPSAWLLFLTRSRYSPTLLGGSFEDAFEDLLRVASGLPMTSTARPLHQESTPPPRTPASIARRTAVFSERLFSAGLLEVYFPLDLGRVYRSPRTAEEWVVRRREEAERERLERAAQEEWRRMWEVGSGEKVVKREVGAGTEEAETEEDLYTWNSPKEGGDRTTVTRRTKEDLGQGVTKETFYRRYVDDQGGVHVETRVTVTNGGDAAGDEPKKPRGSEDKDETTIDNTDSLDDQKSRDGKGPGGWFWK